MIIAQSTAADVAVILSQRHDQGADWWTTPGRKLLKGAPFTTLESALYLMELGVTPQHEALEAAAQLIFDAWREDGRIKTAPSGRAISLPYRAGGQCALPHGVWE